MRLRNPESPSRTIARYVLESVGRFANGIEDRRASRFPRGDFVLCLYPTIEDMTVQKLLPIEPPPNLYPERSTRFAVLTAVVDRSGRGGTRKVKAAFEEVAARYAHHGLHLSWPVSAELVSMAIMGATKSKDSSHAWFVSVRAVECG